MIKTIVHIIGAILLFSCYSVNAQVKPNIIIFYVDDLGWQDVQINELGNLCPYETPNIIKLAEGGMSFTQGYASAPTCSPSRAGIITGRHPSKINITHVTLGSTVNGARDFPLSSPYLDDHLNTDVLTLADALKQNGYRTGHVGKWHDGLSSASYGFDFTDQTRGIHRSLVDRTKDFATADDGKYPLSVEKYPPFSEKKPLGISYPYDQLTESALEFIGDNKDSPFFLNICHWMVHWPVCTRNGELLEYYCDKMGHPFPPPVGDMTLPGQQNPYFAAMVTSVDWSLGRVADLLSRTDDPRNPGKKLIETTYIFFTSDNGGAEKKGYEIISDNYPLKYGKTHVEEGGVRVTTIVSGSGIPPSSQYSGMVSQLDFFPTILNLTDSEITIEDREQLSGYDISPVLLGQSQKIVNEDGVERSNLFWHFPHIETSMKSALREGDYKLIKQYSTGEYELYRLYKDGVRMDLEEQSDLAKNPVYASVVDSLASHLEASLQENNACGPYLNPDYIGKTKVPVAVAKTRFMLSDRKAQLFLKNAAVKEAHVLYVGSSNDPSIQFGVKVRAEISDEGYTVSASIPENVPSFRFILIDSSNFQVYTDVKSAEYDQDPDKEQSNKHVIFNIGSDNTGNPVSNVSVQLGGTELSTGINGSAIFTLLQGEYEYTLSHPDYFTTTSPLELAEDTTIQITLVANKADIKFRVKAEEQPLHNVTFKLGQDSLASNQTGIALFKDINRFEEYDWMASKEGYENIQGTINLLNDTTVNLSMNLLSRVNDNDTNGLRVYPNPTDSKLFILSNASVHRVEICDLRGALLRSVELNEMDPVIDLSGFENGIFIARINREGQRMISLKVMKSDIR